MTAEQFYGSDQTGLICGYVFAADGVGEAIGTVAAGDWLRTRQRADGAAFAWLHFSLTNVNSEHVIVKIVREASGTSVG